jgi:hypothetical protein
MRIGAANNLSAEKDAQGREARHHGQVVPARHRDQQGHAGLPAAFVLDPHPAAGAVGRRELGPRKRLYNDDIINGWVAWPRRSMASATIGIDGVYYNCNKGS